jgi:hypothetical protein
LGLNTWEGKKRSGLFKVTDSLAYGQTSCRTMTWVWGQGMGNELGRIPPSNRSDTELCLGLVSGYKKEIYFENL